MQSSRFHQHYFDWEIAEKDNFSVVTSTVIHALKLSTKIGKPTKDLIVLDVGSGTGQYSFEIGKYVKKVIGVEPFKQAYISSLNKKKTYETGRKCTFYNTPIEEFSTNEKFDLVLCLATLEHMPNAEASFAKIFNYLKDGGIIYLTVPNKLWPYEYHYKLFFLSWLPLKYANAYVRYLRRGKSFEDSAYAKSYFGLKRFLNKFPCRYQFIIPEPGDKYLGQGDTSILYNFIKHFGIRLLKIFPYLMFLSKGFLVVITKQNKEDK